MKIDFEVIADPSSMTASAEDYQQQFDFLIEVRDKLTETHQAIKQIRSARDQINDAPGKVNDEEAFTEVEQAGKSLIKQMRADRRGTLPDQE